MSRSLDKVIDLQTGREIGTVPRVDRPGRDEWVRDLSAGYLVRVNDRLKFYQPGKLDPLWEHGVPKELDHPHPLVSSADKKRIAMGLGGTSENLVQVVSAGTGKTISQISRRRGSVYSGYPLAMAFSQDGDRLIVVHQRSLRVYDVASGRMAYERALADREYLWTAITLSKGWLLGGDDHSLFHDETQNTKVEIPLRRIDRATLLPQTVPQTLLVETSHGLGGIIAVDGTVLRSWVNQKSGVLRNDSNTPPLSGVAFEGRLIARLTGGPGIELLDVKTREPIARIHIVKRPAGWGWIVYTPDGYWDSSPGAEHYVKVFKNGQLAPPAEMQSRLTSSLLKMRLPR